MNSLNAVDSHTYSINDWNNYARLFASVTLSAQLDVYKEACAHLFGDVVDCGCGSAKIAPFLIDQQNIKSYTGLDYSKEMVEVASWVVQQLGRADFNIWQSKIEEFNGNLFDSAVSVQSYYSWPEPEKVLKHIYNMLKPNGIFVLATANPKLPFDEMAKDAWRELLTHPDFEAFKAYNLKLASNPYARFVSLNDLVQEAMQVGFKVESAHQRYFRGGLNFVILSKEA